MRKQQGLSIVELMIAITLGLVLIGGVVQMFLGSRVVFNTQQSLSRVQEAGRFAMHFLGQDIRMAGYFGCVDRTMQVQNDLVVDFWTNFAPSPRFEIHSVEGYTAETLPNIGLSPLPRANTDVLVVRYAAGAPHVVTEAITGVIKVRAKAVVPSANCANGICNNANLVISNCSGARIFRASSVEWANDVTSISHAGLWPDPDDIPTPVSTFFAGNTVLPVNTVVLYVADGAGGPTLYRRESNAAAAVPLVEGIENISFRYSVDNIWRSATEITALSDWLKVNSVSVEVLVQGNEINLLDEPQGYVFAGADVAGPGDRRLRQVFSSVFAIRSRNSLVAELD